MLKRFVSGWLNPTQKLTAHRQRLPVAEKRQIKYHGLIVESIQVNRKESQKIWLS